MQTRMGMLCGLGLLLLGAQALAEPPDPVLVDRARTRALLDDVLEEMARLEGLASARGHNPRLGPELASLRGKLKVLRDDIKRAPSARGLVSVGLIADGEGVLLHAGPHGGGMIVAPAPPAVPAAPTAPPPAVVQAMPPPDYRALLRALEEESFADGKLRVLDDAARSAWFTSEQVLQLLGGFEFGDDQLKALEILAPRLTDPENGFRIFQAFTFDGDKQKAKKILSRAAR